MKVNMYTSSILSLDNQKLPSQNHVKENNIPSVENSLPDKQSSPLADSKKASLDQHKEPKRCSLDGSSSFRKHTQQSANHKTSSSHESPCLRNFFLQMLYF